MKTQSEKEKKLDNALSKLINLNLNVNLKENLQNLNYQKNQLEIEKKEIENKFNNLMAEYEKIKTKLEDMDKRKKYEQKKEIEFSEKIDELNQDTASLLEEIDKWQM